MFKVGDKVEWVSQSAGFTTRKQGEVVAIVPAGRSPGLGFLERFNLQKYRCMFDGLFRDHESYLILVKTKLYWPRVRYLNLIK